MRNVKPLYCEIPLQDFKKLEKLIKKGKFATKVDFIRTKIREEKVGSDGK